MSLTGFGAQDKGHLQGNPQLVTFVRVRGGHILIEILDLWNIMHLPKFFHSVFDKYILNNNFRMEKLDEETLKFWHTNRENPDAQGHMTVRSSQQRSKLEDLSSDNEVSLFRDNGGESKQNIKKIDDQLVIENNYGEQGIYFVTLIKEYLFFFDLSQTEQECLAAKDYQILPTTEKKCQDFTKIHSSEYSPSYYLHIEFAKLRVIKDHTRGNYGFVFALRQSYHELMLIFNHPCSKQLPVNMQGTSEDAIFTIQQQSIDQNGLNLNKFSQNGGIPQLGGRNSVMKVMRMHEVKLALDSNTAAYISQKHISEAEIAHRKMVFKVWMTSLNSVIIRQENLKKYSVTKELGVGGQAKVYLVQKSVKAVQQQQNKGHLIENSDEQSQIVSKVINGGGVKTPNKANTSETHTQLTFAIKVISKSSLSKKSEYIQRQMLKEIKVQRTIKDCGNVLKLHKIYESDQYINLLMDFQEGGTLGDILENKIKLVEEQFKPEIHNFIKAIILQKLSINLKKTLG